MIKNIDYPDYHWVLVDNTENTAYANKLKREHPGHVAHVPRGNNSRDALANASNYLRHKVIREGYDYLLMIESDVFPPKDVVWRLLQHQKKVVGLPYEIDFGENRGLCVFLKEKKQNGMWGTRRVSPQEGKEMLGTGLRQVHGMGVGCTLIHREIIERFPFFYDKTDDERMFGMGIRKHPDVYFYLELDNNGIEVFLDTSALCHHQNVSWSTVKDI